MSFSLNEVEATAKKAARGAGYPWGVAEEAGKAVRWLCGQGLDGCAALAGLLGRFDGASIAEIMPETSGPQWQAAGGVLCPLVTGAALSDRADGIKQAPVSTGKMAEPNLLLSFAAGMARHCKSAITIEWPGGAAVTDGDRLSLTGAPATSQADHMHIACGGTLDAPVKRRTRAAPDARVWDTLNTFAHRTYAPATEESRLKGAGAGTSDRD